MYFTKEILLTSLLFSVILIIGILAVGSFIMSLKALIKIGSLEKATHTVQLMPVEDAKWGLSDKDVDIINNINKDDVNSSFDDLSI